MMLKKQVTTKCSHCDGNGKYGSYGLGDYFMTEHDCMYCKGTGEANNTPLTIPTFTQRMKMRRITDVNSTRL